MKRIIFILSWCVCGLGTLHAQDSIFVDVHLRVLIHEALDRNADIRVASLHIEKAAAMLRSAKLNYLPSFSLSPSGTISKVHSQPGFKTYSLPLTMEWEWQLGGGQQGEQQVAEAQWRQSGEQLRYQQVQLIAELANSYYTLILLDRQIDITRQSIHNQEANLKAIRALHAVGKMDALAVHQADATLQSVRSSFVELESQRSKVETAISLLLDRKAGVIARSSWEKVEGIRMNPSQPIALEQLSSRPDVRSAEYALQAAYGQARVANSALYPTLRITADAGWTNNLGEIIYPGKQLLNLIGGLTQPLFARGALKARRQAAEIERKQAEISFEKALLVAGGEVKDALSECTAAQRKKPLRQAQLEASQKAYEQCQQLLRHSQTVTYIDVLAAQSSLLSAELQYAADWLEGQQALINLYKALCP